MSGLAFLNQGFQQGQQAQMSLALQQMQLKQAESQLAQMQKAVKARSAMAASLADQLDDNSSTSDVSQTTAPPPGQASQPAQLPMPPPQGQQGPQQGGLSTPQLLRQPPQGQAAFGQTPPQQGPQQPPGMVPPPGGVPGVPGAQQPQGAFAILQGIAKKLVQANPGLKSDPETLGDALVQTVDLMKGVAPEAKDQLAQMADYMRYNAQLDKIQQDSQTAVMKAQNAAEIAQIRADTTAQIAALSHGDRQAALAEKTDTDQAKLKQGDERLTQGQERIDNAKVITNFRLQGATDKAAAQSIVVQIQDINSKIKELTATSKDATGQVSPAAQAEIQKMQQARSKLASNLSGQYALTPDQMQKLIDGKAVIAASAPASPPPPPAAPAAAAGGAPKVTSQAQYDALPAGATYVDPDGVTRTKGGG